MFILKSISDCVVNTRNVCSDVEILNVLQIIKTLVEIITIVVPVILTIFIMVDIVKTISSTEADTKKLFKSIVKRLIAAVLIFLVPYIVDFILGIIPNEKFYWDDCWTNAEKDQVVEVASQNAIESEEYLVCILENSKTGNEEHYRLAYNAYEQLRIDIDLIPTNKDKNNLETHLDIYKSRVDLLKPQK